MVGSARLKKNESLLIMAGTAIHCGREFGFRVEFPDLATASKSMSGITKGYATKLGFPDAQAEYLPIGAEDRSVAVLGKGAFGEVHKALHTKTATQFAIKILNGGGKNEMNEVNIMSRPKHVS